MRTLRAAASVFLLLGAAACDVGDGGGDSSDGVAVYTSVYPLEWLANQVGGEHVSVTNLTDPGTDPHDLELSPRQIGEIADADLVVYIAGMQPAVDEAVAQHADGQGLDVADVVDLREVADEEGGGLDPHMWLDPELFSVVAERLSERLAEVDPDHAEDYRGQTAAKELADIDSEYQSGLADCARREFVVSHAAFGYLADRYDLDQISISGIEPDTEPSPARLREVAELVEELEITTVFTEVLASEQVADVLAEETGVDTAVLDPLEGITERSPGDDYPSVMRANLDALSSAQECA